MCVCVGACFSCISMKMMYNDTGEVICEERPIYGGTGKIDEKRFDEIGYILQVSSRLLASASR
jgi:hypothetical protein